MRGIAGILYPDFFQANERIFDMLDTMKHRGGPLRGTHAFKNLELGMVGGELVSNEKKSIFLGLDGTIYNRMELCRELITSGYHLDCRPDSDVVLHGYEMWGTKIFEKLRGDFGLMILDQRKNQLLLARNRIGKKPLYWYQDKHHFIFASELKAILSTGLVPQTPALDAMASYLYFGYIPQDLSPIKGVSKLLPGYFLRLQLDGSKSIHQYWSFSQFLEPKSQKNQEQLEEELRGLLSESVEIRIPDEGKVGCFISGGIGSASVAHFLSKDRNPQSISAFTVGFKGESEEDVEAAADVAELFHLDYHQESITPANFLDDLVKIAWYLEEPIADPNTIAIWQQAKLAAGSVGTVFTGMGCDEMFAGHTRYVTTPHDEQHVRFQSTWAFLRRLLTPVANYIYKPLAYEFLRQEKTNLWQFEYLRNNALFSESVIAKASPRLASLFDPETFLHKFHQLFRVKSTLESYLYFDVKTRLPDNYILMLERLTAAHSLEWRAPYLDSKLVEFAAGLPEPKFLREEDVAFYLKPLFQRELPPQVVNRPKKTRQEFLRPWLSGFEMRTLFEQLPESSLVDSGLISEKWLRGQLRELSTSPTAFRYLWAILMLEIWYRLYIIQPVRVNPPEIKLKDLLAER